MKSAELCAGYGGLALAVNEVFGSTTAWLSEFEDAPSRILAHHWPNVPNHGDMTKIDWSAVEPVDIIAGGTPCQDLSGAGKRAGMSEGTRSNLWVQMREAVAIIKPKYVVWENVRGAYSACASSEVDSVLGRCPRCLDPKSGSDHSPNLRALGRVLGDLSDLGYDCQWRGLRAADVGAPHGRFRVFVLATRPGVLDTGHSTGSTQQGDEFESDDGFGESSQGVPGAEPAHADNQGPQGQRDTAGTTPAQRHGYAGAGLDGPTADTLSEYRGQRRESGSSETQGGRASAVYSGRGGTSTATNTQGGRCGVRQSNDEWAPRGTLNTPRDDSPTASGAPGTQTHWGQYEPAIRRWEALRGAAPNPTEPTGRNGNHRLSASFCEWMMGVPDGWIVDVPGVSRNEALKAAGNGVVPQQAIAALRDMLATREALEVA